MNRAIDIRTGDKVLINDIYETVISNSYEGSTHVITTESGIITAKYNKRLKTLPMRSQPYIKPIYELPPNISNELHDYFRLISFFRHKCSWICIKCDSIIPKGSYCNCNAKT